MKLARLTIENFRGIRAANILFPDHAVFAGDNNSGKSTILEAIDLVLGPDRLSKKPVIDEHDFFGGSYLTIEGIATQIRIEALLVDLNADQLRHFRDHVEWWDTSAQAILDGPPPERTDDAGVVPALRVEFIGAYDVEEDDFVGHTHFLSPALETGSRETFQARDKRLCGFLYLRTIRTGARALSLERGSSLDIILRMRGDRLQMWEAVLTQLRAIDVAPDPALGISTILTKVQEAVRALVPAEWAESPHLRVSDLTRETLRRTLTVFMTTGVARGDGRTHAAPFQHQGQGTINTLVLALLSLIADLKQNVIFAMEEPEIALPPQIQRRVIDSVRRQAAQALFTSHSPYVLDEFEPAQIVVVRRTDGVVSASPASCPPSVKPKAYRSELRSRFCEALLARRVLIVEGRTEYDAFPAASRRLNELDAGQFKTLDAMGVAVVSANTVTQIEPLAHHFRQLGKTVFAVFDKHAGEVTRQISAAASHAYEAPERGFEDVVLNGTRESALRRFAVSLVDAGEWPPHLADSTPTATATLDAIRGGLRDYLAWSKGSSGAAELLGQCRREEMPEFVVDTLQAIQRAVESSLPQPAGAAPV